ncbi:MAG: acyl-CoA dehydrogenase family protein [Hyphomicrobiales bacterium]
MPPRQPIAVFDSHEVTNQPPPLVDYNLFDSDPILGAAVAREGAGWAAQKLHAFGAVLGSERVAELAEAANRHPPELRVFDRSGCRIDEVLYHPAYHELMQLAKAHEVHSIAWTAAEPGGHVAHMGLEYLLIQAEAGVCCPITMTYAAVPALAHHPQADEWLRRVTAAAYDPRSIPAAEKAGLTIGMAMTEKQGGSDVRSNATKARALGNGWFELTGHKWFCSAPMSDAFLTLAYTDAGLSCFLLPRWRPDGSRNPFLIQRLKDKLGDRSNASAEIEYKQSWAELIGEEGHGVRAIIEMVHHTRLDTAVAAAGMMRAGVVQAVHHAGHRVAFQKRLFDQPLMRNVLADLVIEWVAATLMAARVARCYGEPGSEPLARIAVAIAKYWLNKRLPGHVCEALECHGGSGYVEESPMPRLYRQAPVNGIWEGSGNVICLDVLRSLEREPAAAEALLAELAATRGGDRRLDRAVERLKDELRDPADRQSRARRIVGWMAVALQASLLVRHGPATVADAFCASRLDHDWGGAYGTLPAGTAFEDIVRLGRVSG